jgi:membrane-bound ClpP family serine protease
MANWNDVLREIQKKQTDGQQALDIIRRKYLNLLYKYTDRNVIAYYSGWLSKPGIAQTNIIDEDKNGFMMAIHKMDRNKGLDLFLHTPGGDLAATESIIDYLRQMFGKNIRAIVPQLAMSAGTILACSCKEIVMGKHSNLGPIDPHLNGIPARGVIEEFETAYNEIKKDPIKQVIWNPILNKYHPTFLSQCKNSIEWGTDIVQEQLINVMFDGEPKAAKKAETIVKELNDYSGNKSHGRHLHFDQLKKMGLKLVRLEGDDKLQELVLTVHHSYIHTLMNSLCYKIIENHNGVALVKHTVPPK